MLGVWMCVVLLASNASGSLRSAVVGGHDAARGRWPWMVYVDIREGKIPGPCGGSLITDQWVLTAGHCIKNPHLLNPDPETSYVRLGEWKLKKPIGEKVKIQRFILHPDYKHTKTVIYNDVALLQLKSAVGFDNYISPVTLPGDKINPHKCWVTGWGTVKERRPLPGDQTLQELQVPLLDDAICRSMYPKVTKGMLCAGYIEGGKDACQGDSGGPLVCESFGVFVQVGVVSFGEGCARANRTGVYTRVEHYLSFIKETINTYSSF
ncbi:brain-specific serine protease 4-like [Engraulis encrasicolus]|uniref:brain-specific serine protease 4-like n=1 Tax=Engraulis encrasicolus TaxID=184585 RepID=UPI002FD49A70